MFTMTIQELEREPSAFCRAILAGQKLIITSQHAAIAVVEPMPASGTKRFTPGTYVGDMWMSEDFDKPLEIVDAVEKR